jgi:transcriptional regulator with XRE-family HTH domain
MFHACPFRAGCVDTTLAKIIGQAARTARKALSLTQEDAAERIGISLEFYARIERGRTYPSVPTLARMADALDASADVLLGTGSRVSFARDRSRGSSWSERTGRTDSSTPELRRIVRRLSRAEPRTLRLINSFVSALERR